MPVAFLLFAFWMYLTMKLIDENGLVAGIIFVSIMVYAFKKIIL